MNDRKWAPPGPGSLAGRRIVITGANSGIGYASASLLAAAGANIVMGCRSIERAEQAAERLRRAHPASIIDLRRLDLADLGSIRAFADSLTADGRPIDVLMNNAGVMAVDRSTTVDGFETQLGTNHLGHFALAGLLLPTLATNPDGARIVTVSSMGHRPGRLDLADPFYERRRYRRWNAYFQSKLANLLFNLELQRRLEAAGSTVVAIAAHPGTAATNLGKDGNSLSNRVIRSAFPAVVRGPEPAALSQVRAAVDPTVPAGSYLGPRWTAFGPPVTARPSRRARRTADARALWEFSEQATGISYPI
jgi:NAD(P)-dependent dehydrogenase (short-subunit alcohol dehydrogenase family)